MKKSSIVGIILVTLATILYFIANIQRVAIPGAIFDVLQQDLCVSAKSITALGTIFMYVYAFSQLVIGVLVTRYGGFRVITLGGIVFFAGCILFPLSHTVQILYLSRFFVGFGAATFYLSIINETKKIVPARNFGIVLSIILFVGYVGGIVANAPLVMSVNKLGWRETFLITAIMTAIIVFLFVVVNKFIDAKPVDRTVHFNFDLFKEVLKNKKNMILYNTICLNYALYYVFQTILGKKFLEDFCLISTMSAAIVLSVMSGIYAISGPLCAVISKAILYRKTIFFKITSFNLFAVFSVILICLIFNVRTPLIAGLFCIISVGTNLSPLAIPLLQDYNSKKVSAAAISFMSFGFFLLVGILGSVSGVLLDYFTPSVVTGAKVYSNNSYIAIFIVMIILALMAFINVFRVQESRKTTLLIKHVKYLKEHSDKNMPENYGNYIG